jgi:autotransporter-associated beta strand protein
MALACVTMTLTLNAQAEPWVRVTGSLPDVTGKTFDQPVSGTMPDGLLLGARYGNNFALVAGDGSVSAASYDTETGSGKNFNVTAAGNWEDITVQSLRFQTSSTLNLTGVNTIESGGIIFAASGRIYDGTLQAGEGNHLWVYLGSANSEISSVIAGSGGLELVGGSNNAGTIKLSGNNIFTGDVTFRGVGSTLYLANPTALGGSSKLTVLGGNTIDFSDSAMNNAYLSKDLSIERGSSITFGGNSITLSGSKLFGEVGTSAGLTFKSTEGGALFLEGETTHIGHFVLSGAGMVYITGNYTFVGESAVNGGNLSVIDGGTLVGTTANTTFGSNAVVTLNVGGVIKNTLYDWKIGAATVNQEGGTFDVARKLEFTNAAGQYNLNGGIFTASATNTDNAIISGNVGILALNSGTISVARGGNRTMTSGTILVRNGGGNFELTNNTVLTVQKALQHDGPARDGGIAKTGNGTLILSGANTYTGNTIVDSGTFTLAANASLLFQMDENLSINVMDNSAGGFINLGNTGVSITLDLIALAENTPDSSMNWTLFAGNLDNYNLGNLAVNFTGGNWSNIGENEWKWEIDADSYYTFTRNTGLLAYATIPEPSTLFLLGSGTILLAFLRRRRS